MFRDSESVVCVSGYFNPIHKGHILMFSEAKKLADKLVVIINNDKQVELKGSKKFMAQYERTFIVDNIKGVDAVIISCDKDKSVCETLSKIKPDIFANGGDRKSQKDILESEVCTKYGIKMVFNIGGKKIQSSSKLKGEQCE